MNKLGKRMKKFPGICLLLAVTALALGPVCYLLGDVFPDRKGSG